MVDESVLSFVEGAIVGGAMMALFLIFAFLWLDGKRHEKRQKPRTIEPGSLEDHEQKHRALEPFYRRRSKPLVPYSVDADGTVRYADGRREDGPTLTDDGENRG